MQLKKYRKKDIMIVSGLLGILFAVPIINTNSQSLASTNQDYFDRSIASAQYSFQNSLQYIQNQQNLLKSLAKNSKDGYVHLSSRVGKRPSQIEQFQFGFLSGNYNVTHNEGGISQLTVQSEINESDLRKIKNREEFLKEYRSFWFIPFQYVEKAIEVQVSDRSSEIFILKNSKNQSVGKATILSNKEGGMISLNLTEFSHNKKHI